MSWPRSHENGPEFAERIMRERRLTLLVNTSNTANNRTYTPSHPDGVRITLAHVDGLAYLDYETPITIGTRGWLGPVEAWLGRVAPLSIATEAAIDAAAMVDAAAARLARDKARAYAESMGLL